MRELWPREAALAALATIVDGPRARELVPSSRRWRLGTLASIANVARLRAKRMASNSLARVDRLQSLRANARQRIWRPHNIDSVG